MKTILLVEDDPFLIDIYKTKFKEENFNLEVIRNGSEALKKIKEKNLHPLKYKKVWPDLLILDIVLPEMDGWQILEQLNKDEKLREIKVIIFSNLGQKEEVEKGLKLGASKYLVKAYFTPSEVIEEVKKILK